MTFSLQNNPYFPIYPPMQYSDPALLRKALALRQTLDSRLQGSNGMDLLNSLLAAYACSKFSSQDLPSTPKFPFPPLSPLFSSPSLFQQALASAFQPGNLPLPRQFPEDLSVPSLPPRSSEGASQSLPRLSKKTPSSPAGFKRKQNYQDYSTIPDRERMDSILYCQPTFYPFLKDQVEKTHQSLRAVDAPKLSLDSSMKETGVLVPSLIDGEIIMGFNVWGEKRLCLPHLFRFVLNDVDLKAIDEACTKLQITCTTCTPAQLTLLHSRKILPKAVSSCGLIRKSDAERLTKFIRNRMDSSDRQSNAEAGCEVLPCPKKYHAESEARDLSVEGAKRHSTLNKNSSQTREESAGGKEEKSNESDTRSSLDSDCRECPSPQEQTSNTPIPVVHECFGRQLGLIHTHLYTEPSSKCIECHTCHRLFSPDQFVGHTHTVTEVDNLNHWGFDSNNWRCYLRLYTGHRSRSKNSKHSPSDELSEDETDRRDASPYDFQVHRRLEEFKIKFAQPIRLPASLSAALRTVGLCASIAPIPPALATPDIHSISTTPSGIQPLNAAFAKSSNTKDICVPPLGAPPLPPNLPAPSPVAPVMLPQLTLRRLWAPNDGRIRVPPPPKPLNTRDDEVLPKRLQTGPPLLLHSHRVVSQAAADRYDRDFIPNVCLMPPLKPKSVCPSGQNWCTKRHPFRRNRDASSGSRSCSSSAHSSGSSSSRTRSASVSSNNSSGSSYCRPGKRHCNGLAVTSHNEKADGRTSPRLPDELNTSKTENKTKRARKLSYKWGAKSRPRSNSWSAGTRRRSSSQTSESARSDSYINLYIQQLSASKRRRCRSLTYNKRVEVTEPSVPPQNTSQTPSGGQESMKRKLAVDVDRSNRSEELPRQRKMSYSKQPHHYEAGWQDRAMAAAKAAQGIASRTCPGLWSRHFTNLNGSHTGPLNLPNARERLHETDANGAASDRRSSHPRVSANNTPVLVTNPMKNSLPSAVLALEAIWADLVRHISEYTVAVESRTGVADAKQRLFEQFISMQTCYATHIATLANDNQRLLEKLNELEKRQSSMMNSKSPPNSVASSPSSGQEWRRSTNLSKHHLPNPVQSSTSTPQHINKSPSTSVFPHRSRKESTRMFSDYRQGAPRSGDLDRQFCGTLDGRSKPNAFCGKTIATTASSPNYTVSSSEDTNQASTTPTASESDAMQLEHHARYISDYPDSFDPHGSGNSPSHSTKSGQSFVSSKDRRLTTNPEETRENMNSSEQVEGAFSPISDSPRRRWLLPPCDERPRMCLKPRSRLLTRS